MIYQRIAEYLTEKGIKQSIVAEKAGLSRMAMSEALRGKRKIEVEEYAAICEALELPPEKFINEDTMVSS